MHTRSWSVALERSPELSILWGSTSGCSEISKAGGTDCGSSLGANVLQPSLATDGFQTSKWTYDTCLNKGKPCHH